MRCLNAQTETFIYAQLEGHEVLYNDLRIDRSSVPEGIYAYDIRHGDEDWGYAAQLKEHVLVNHMATILSDHKIELPDQGDSLILENNLEFLDYSMTLEEYQNRHVMEEQEISMEHLE